MQGVFLFWSLCSNLCRSKIGLQRGCSFSRALVGNVEYKTQPRPLNQSNW